MSLMVPPSTVEASRMRHYSAKSFFPIHGHKFWAHTESRRQVLGCVHWNYFNPRLIVVVGLSAQWTRGESFCLEFHLSVFCHLICPLYCGHLWEVSERPRVFNWPVHALERSSHPLRKVCIGLKTLAGTEGRSYLWRV